MTVVVGFVLTTDYCLFCTYFSSGDFCASRQLLLRFDSFDRGF